MINVTCGDAPYVCDGGPGYDTYAGKFAAGGAADAYPYSAQDDKYSALHGASAGGAAVTMYGPEQVPVKARDRRELRRLQQAVHGGAVGVVAEPPLHAARDELRHAGQRAVR